MEFKKDQITFSIIIPVHNRFERLKFSIFSILLQNFDFLNETFEIILVDDNSKDNLKIFIDKVFNDLINEKIFAFDEIINRFNFFNRFYKKSKICLNKKLIEHFYNNIYVINNLYKKLNPAAARNSGLEKAKGEIILFLDSDDLWLPDKLITHLKYHSFGYQIIISDELWAHKNILINKPYDFIFNNNLEKKFYKKNIFGLSATSINRSLIKRLKIYYSKIFNEDYLICEDYDFFFRCFKIAEPIIIKEKLIIKIGGFSDQITYKKNKKIYENYAKIRKNNLNFD